MSDTETLLQAMDWAALDGDIDVAIERSVARSLLDTISTLQAENNRLRYFRDQCSTLTGTLWPQNETTNELALLIRDSGK